MNNVGIYTDFCRLHISNKKIEVFSIITSKETVEKISPQL
jgi:hypothetical protein